jgi:hypothetical protein
VAIRVRHRAADIRAGAGLEDANDYRALNGAFMALSHATFLFVSEEDEPLAVPILREVVRLHRNHVEYELSAMLASFHRRSMDRYALLNMDHIRKLKRPLDHVVYEHGCLVVRMRHPEFTLQLWQLARFAKARSATWSAVKGPFLGACQRVAAVVGAQFRIIARCTGDAPCVDEFRVMPQRPGAAVAPQREPGALLFLFDAEGARRLE